MTTGRPIGEIPEWAPDDVLALLLEIRETTTAAHNGTARQGPATVGRSVNSGLKWDISQGPFKTGAHQEIRHYAACRFQTMVINAGSGFSRLIRTGGRRWTQHAVSCAQAMKAPKPAGHHRGPHSDTVLIVDGKTVRGVRISPQSQRQKKRFAQAEVCFAPVRSIRQAAGTVQALAARMCWPIKGIELPPRIKRLGENLARPPANPHRLIRSPVQRR